GADGSAGRPRGGATALRRAASGRRPSGSDRETPGGSGSLERGLRLARESPEGLRVADRELRENLPVELDVRRLQAGDQLVVREPVRARARVDPNDPEPPERPLAVLPVAIRVRQRVLDLLL